jgi:DNA (cytosine-5)-methyltransferase 1
MKAGSLFSGIGGLDLGLERAGLEIVWQVEIDDWCRRVLERHWPDVARFRDVRDCHGAAMADATGAGCQARGGNGMGEGESPRRLSSPCGGCLPSVDLICGGFPCQPVSHAGRRTGESDPRWLWPEFYRIIREVRPRWVLAENVPGLRSIDDGRVFGGILRDLAEAGYDAVWFDLSAADVGAPHLRERVFIVAHAERSRPSRSGCGHEPEGAKRSAVNAGAEVAYASGTGLPTRDERRSVAAPGRGTLQGCEPIGRDAAETGRQWAVEPSVGRVASGIPARVDRLRGLGNAVVPQVAEVIGRWIVDADKGVA